MSLAGLLQGDKKLFNRAPIIQFSRMNAPRPKYGDACVLLNKWRLLNDKELYDVASDPAQERDVAAEHPQIVSVLREHYRDWWSRLQRINEPSAITVGNDAENPVHLSPADWFDAFIDQQRQVRMASKVNGPWHLEVAQAGEYEITVSRWPLEAELPITAAAPEHKGPDGTYPPGVAIPATRARLKIADVDAEQPIAADTKSLTFTVTLPKGRTTLQTWLYDKESNELCGAYYARVRRK
jgi:arylsulfatase